MENLTAKLSIGFVVLCEWLISGVLLLAIVPSFIEALKNQNEKKWFDAVFLSPVLLGCAFAGYGLIRRTRWGWFVSLLVGLAMGIFGASCMWSASRDTQYARMESGYLFGTGLIILLPSVAGLMVLNLPATRRYVFLNREAADGLPVL